MPALGWLSYTLWLAHMSISFRNLVNLAQIALLVISSSEVNCTSELHHLDNSKLVTMILCSAVTSGPLCSETYPSVPFGYVDSTGAKVYLTQCFLHLLDLHLSRHCSIAILYILLHDTTLFRVHSVLHHQSFCHVDVFNAFMQLPIPSCVLPSDYAHCLQKLAAGQGISLC